MKPMRPLRTLLIYTVAVFLVAALLAPWLYRLVQMSTPAHPVLQPLAAKAFPHYFETCLLALALAGLWPLCRGLGANSWVAVGLVKPAGQWQRLLTGFLLGFISLALVAGVTLAVGRRAWDVPSLASIPPKVLRAVLTAAVVAVLEEVLFRGGVFGGLRRVFDWRIALLLSSVIYAVAHFLQVRQLSGPVTWVSGLELLARMPSNLVAAPQVVPAVLNLTVAGVLLGLAYQRTGNLYFSIGLHAGWIFWLKSYGALTRRIPGAAIGYWGSGRMIDGWLAFIALAVAFVLVNHFTAARREPLK
jgi:uncharacterized protein